MDEQLINSGTTEKENRQFHLSLLWETLPTTEKKYVLLIMKKQY